MESISTLGIFLVLLAAIAVPYWLRIARKKRKAKADLAKNTAIGLAEPVTLHPRIDLMTCIGCGSCVESCPEDVLGIVDGHAAVVNATRCVSHALCVEACPVGAITMGFGKPREGMEIPWYTEHHESNIPGLYIVGELGGIGLIRNAFQQGVEAVEHLTRSRRNGKQDFDAVIVGAGPAGIAAALSAQAAGLRYVVFEQYELGGSILHYPRRKLVLTRPAELPMFGTIEATEISKEDLLKLFATVAARHRLNIKSQHKVEGITADNTGGFVVRCGDQIVTASHVILALGRRGSPRKLNVPGEDLPKVMYRLIEAESIHHQRIMVVGGGDSAIEAAVALSRQRETEVTVSYRRSEFVRLKEKNERNFQEAMRRGSVRVIFDSEVMRIEPESVHVKERRNIDHTIANDLVYIFAGGEMPAEFLKKIGVKARDTEEQSEAHRVP